MERELVYIISKFSGATLVYFKSVETGDVLLYGDVEPLLRKNKATIEAIDAEYEISSMLPQDLYEVTLWMKERK